MKINLTYSDMVKGQPITPNWYKVEIVNFRLKSPKSGGESLNYVPTFKIPDLQGLELDHTFNSQAPGLMTPFIAAVRNVPVRTLLEAAKANGGKLTPEFDSDEPIGKKIQIKIKNEEYQGRLVNKVDGFLPYDAVVPF